MSISGPSTNQLGALKPGDGSTISRLRQELMMTAREERIG